MKTTDERRVLACEFQIDVIAAHSVRRFVGQLNHSPKRLQADTLHVVATISCGSSDPGSIPYYAASSCIHKPSPRYDGAIRCSAKFGASSAKSPPN
jgi:hypothetical protein